MGLKHRDLANDEGGWIMFAGVAILAAVSILGTYWLVSPIGDGIGDAFTIFGQDIALYIVIGLVILGGAFLWLVFGRSN